MKRLLTTGLILLTLTAAAFAESIPADGNALEIVGSATEGTDVRVVRFEAQPETDPRAANVNALLDARFEQARAATTGEQALARGWRIWQKDSVYMDEGVASIGLLWQGRQADGTDGCSAYALTLDRTTGAELTFGDLFADADAAAERMEEIIERDVLPELSDYMEYADLLPVPRDCFWFDAGGFTVGYPDDRYRYFGGGSGTVHFMWHELADLIPEDSPLYGISRPEEASAEAIRALIAEGRFGEGMPYGVGDRLGDALDALTLLADPDYARDSALGGSFRLYLFEESALRGFTLETPLYADTAEEETPVSGVRATRMSWHGLTPGATTREEIVSLLGEPDRVAAYDEDDARDAMIVPGESLIYARDGKALYAHVDETGTLAMLALRDE